MQAMAETYQRISGRPVLADTEKAGSPLEVWFASLHAAVSELSVKLDILEGRIEPVMVNGGGGICSPDGPIPSPAPVCELQQRCGSVERRLVDLVDRVHGLTNRVSL